MINECALRPDICGNGKCIDTRDGYECDCYSGFTKKAGRCEDIDECLLGYCEGGTCQNYEGSYTCQCPPGFVVAGEGRYCTGERFKGENYLYTSIRGYFNICGVCDKTFKVYHISSLC